MSMIWMTRNWRKMEELTARAVSDKLAWWTGRDSNPGPPPLLGDLARAASSH